MKTSFATGCATVLQVTVFFDKDSRLALTHICVCGKRPAMVMKSADSKTIQFDFACEGVHPRLEGRMEENARPVRREGWR